MDKNLFIEAVKYYDPTSILVITPDKKLIRLFCPFKVRVVQSIGQFKTGQIVNVEFVKTNPKDQIIYCIQGINYLHRYFIVLENQ